MVIKAESCLELLVKSVQDRSIAVGTLELLADYSKQFLVLGEIIQKSRETSSINNAFNQCREELVAFLKEKEILKSFLDFCEHFKTGWCNVFVSVVQHNKFCNKRSVLRRQSGDTNRNIKRSVYCQYG